MKKLILAALILNGVLTGVRLLSDRTVVFAHNDLTPEEERIQREILSHFSLMKLSDGTGRNVTTIRITGANLQIVNGSGATTEDRNGLGNLIVGYQAIRESDEGPNMRQGSHNLVVGDENNYEASGGIVAGRKNSISADYVSVIGGAEEQAALVVSGPDLEFGLVPVGITRTQTLILQNAGDAPLNLSDISGVRSPFSYASGYDTKLDPGEATELMVSFAPTTQEPYEQDLTIASDDPNQGQVKVHLRGQGQGPARPDLVVSGPDLEFGLVPVGKTRTQTLILQNAGDAPLNLSDISGVSAPFSYASGYDTKLDPGQATELKVSFTPTSARPYKLELWIQSDDPNHDTLKVQLHGQGQPQISP